jgi:hypothetical protein
MPLGDGDGVYAELDGIGWVHDQYNRTYEYAFSGCIYSATPTYTYIHQHKHSKNKQRIDGVRLSPKEDEVDAREWEKNGTTIAA